MPIRVADMLRENANDLASSAEFFCRKRYALNRVSQGLELRLPIKAFGVCHAGELIRVGSLTTDLLSSIKRPAAGALQWGLWRSELRGTDHQHCRTPHDEGRNKSEQFHQIAR
jgi:hypothetical protein